MPAPGSRLASARRCAAGLAALTLAPPAVAAAGKGYKAAVLCGVVGGGKVKYVVPTDDGRRLADPIACAVHLESTGGGPLKAFVSVTDGREEKESHWGAINKGKDYEVQLQPGVDFTVCGDFIINAEVQRDDQDGPPVWQTKIPVTQRCPGGAGKAASGTPPTRPASSSQSPPAQPQQKPAKTSDKPIPVAPPVDSHPEVEVGAKWMPNQLAELPDEDARTIAKRLANAIVDEDAQEIDSLINESPGFTIDKKKYTPAQMKKAVSEKGVVGVAKGFEATQQCDDFEKHEGCKWPEWNVDVHGPDEFLIYAPGGMYGKIRAPIFRRVNGHWAWLGFGFYDMGEP